MTILHHDRPSSRTDTTHHLLLALAIATVTGTIVWAARRASRRRTESIIGLDPEVIRAARIVAKRMIS